MLPMRDHFSAKKATWLFIRHFADLKKKEREELATLRQTSETAETIYQFVQTFLQMVRTLGGEHLESWLRSVRACAIPELRRFANGLEHDKAAVLVGLTLFHNNRQTEGQVTRIKLDFEDDVWACGVCTTAPARPASLLIGAPRGSVALSCQDQR